MCLILYFYIIQVQSNFHCRTLWEIYYGWDSPWSRSWLSQICNSAVSGFEVLGDVAQGKTWQAICILRTRGSALKAAMYAFSPKVTDGLKEEWKKPSMSNWPLCWNTALASFLISSDNKPHAVLCKSTHRFKSVREIIITHWQKKELISF